MSLRFVYLIDADQNLGDHLLDELHRHGFRVEAANDGNELLSRKDDLPSLIVLCIDPKRTGWAVCNRLRKSPVLKSLPLIITSAEATEKDFEDHKKLKQRADEYLHKPFGVDALVEKIAGLIGMPEPPTASLEPAAGGDDVLSADELAIEDDSAIIEEESAELYDAQHAHQAHGNVAGADHGDLNEPLFPDDEEDDHTRVMMDVDGDVNVATEAAFAAIGADESTNVTSQSPARLVSHGRPVSRNLTTEVPLDEPFGDDDPFRLAPEAGAMPAPLPPADSRPIAVMRPQIERSEPLDLGLDDVAAQAASEVATGLPERRTRPPSQSMATISPPPAPLLLAPTGAAGDTQAHDMHEATLTELRKERDTFRQRVDELEKKLAQKPAEAPAAATSGFSREREFLNLRETINKKEREVLNLKDALDAKDRQLLDQSGKMRELERTASDLEERSLGTEKELVAAKEKIEALANDKERVVEREKQVKARLDDALKAVARYEEELDGARRKHAADAAAAAESLKNAIAKHEHEVAGLKSDHAQVLDANEKEHAARLQELVDSHEQHKAQLIGQHDEQRGQLEAEHASQMESLRESARVERDGLRLRFEQQLEDATTHAQAELHKTRAEHATALAALKEEHTAALVEKDQLHSDEIAGLRARATKDAKEAERRHHEEVAQLAEAHRRELAGAVERHQLELHRKEQDHQAELHALAADHTEATGRAKADHELALSALDERRQGELREAAAAHQNELDRTRAELEQRLADELKSARDQHMRKMTALEESHADLKIGMQQRHAEAIEKLQKEHSVSIAEFEQALSERDQLITEGHAKMAELEQQLTELQSEMTTHKGYSHEIEKRLATALDDLNAREATLNERAQRINELEREAVEYQDQILKAYQRIKSDESVVSRAKKALGIALTLLEESAPDGTDQASS